jgi:hypothetical protein
MNKRIKELVEQAEFAYEHDGIILSLVLERFAELIVRECASIAKKEQEFNNRFDQDMVKIDQCILIDFGL